MPTDDTPPAIVTIGYGGWHAEYQSKRDKHGSSRRSVSGYGDDWRRYLESMDADAPIVNLRAIPEDDPRLGTLVIAGPMVNPDLEEGLVSTLSGAMPFDPRPEVGRPERQALLGNAHSFDYVGPKTYAAIAAKYGAHVTTAGAEREPAPAEDAEAARRRTAQAGADAGEPWAQAALWQMGA